MTRRIAPALTLYFALLALTALFWLRLDAVLDATGV